MKKMDNAGSCRAHAESKQEPRKHAAATTAAKTALRDTNPGDRNTSKQEYLESTPDPEVTPALVASEKETDAGRVSTLLYSMLAVRAPLLN